MKGLVRWLGCGLVDLMSLVGWIEDFFVFGDEGTGDVKGIFVVLRFFMYRRDDWCGFYRDAN
jgi:hypothetical protein